MNVTRILFPVVMTAIIALVVTLVATLANVGLQADFVGRWLMAYAMSWPVAATTAFFALPAARRVTDWLVAKM